MFEQHFGFSKVSKENNKNSGIELGCNDMFRAESERFKESEKKKQKQIFLF